MRNLEARIVAMRNLEARIVVEPMTNRILSFLKFITSLYHTSYHVS